MKIFKLTYIFTLLLANQAFSQKYAVDQIPTKLKEDKNAVVRYNSGEFEILSRSKAKYKKKKVVTILNRDGNHHAVVVAHYDKLISVNSVEANKYDASGKRIRKIRKSDFNDESLYSESFYEDNRVLWKDLRQDKFPYTIEFEYEITYKFLYTIPDWYFVERFNESVEYSSYTIKSPKALKPRFKTIKAEEPKISTDGETFIATWTESSIQAIPYEPYSMPLSHFSPKVVVSPSQFEFKGYKGDMSSWDGFAAWINELNNGRETLPTETEDKIKKLTSGMSDYLKTKTIYEYMQNRTRYVSIQLGIGGQQPFPAKFVDEEGYGDCKALSFYTQSLLKSVGIKSHYTLVSAGDNPKIIDPDFPNDTFNHIILCVPNKGDTVWLECTNQLIPFGFLGDFTSDRDVFVVTNSGGKIVRTPSYSHDDNSQITKSEVELFEDGNAKIKSDIFFSGLRYDSKIGVLNSGKENQKKWIENNIKISSFILDDFEFKNNKEQIPTASLEATMIARNLSSQSGSRYFFQPNLMNKNVFIPNKDNYRIREMNIKFDLSETDSVFYTLPENCIVEAFFNPIEITSQFGTYKAEITQLEDGRILYTRTFKEHKGLYDPILYQEFTDFHKRVVRADKKRISFKKKT